MVELFKQMNVVRAIHKGMWNASWSLVTGRRCRRFINSQGFKGLHVGCGHNVLTGWFNTDLFTSRIVTEHTLAACLRLAGFVDIKRVPVGEGNKPLLCGIKGHGKLPGIGSEINSLESLVLEAVRADGLNQVGN